MHTDVMKNSCYGPRKLNPGPPLSIAIKNLSAYSSVPQLFLCTWLHTMKMFYD